MNNNKGINRISPQELHQQMKESENLFLIDTLTKDHFQKVHIPGSESACVFEVIFLENISKIVPDKEKKIVVYGFSEKTMDAATAADKLLRAGYRNVCILEGGLQKWNADGLPLEGLEISSVEIPEQVLSLEDRKYTVDTEQSVIEWAGRNPNSKHHGTIKLSKGEIVVKEGEIGGSFTIDMASIQNVNLEGDPLQSVLVSHLMSDDFFFVEKFPEAIFTIQSAKPIEELTFSVPNIEVTGTLELCGMKNDLGFVTTVNPTAEGGITTEAHFDFDRTKWNVIYGSTRFFKHLGMHLVFDLISIQMRILAG
ncbi:YceI family protein [Thermodesulfobacteriota bacterium]